MKLGRVLTYKDVNLTVRLIGKRCKFSNALSEIEHGNGSSSILSKVYRHNDYPFAFNLPSGTGCYQFIREVIEDETDKPRYKPYDLSDPKVRDSLRGRWYKVEDPDGTREEMVTRFLSPAFTKIWEVNGWTVERFLKYCHWIDDGTPCGRLMNMEVR